MKAKILFTIAAASLAAVGNGAPGVAAGGTVVGPVGTPTSQTPQPITSQTPGLTVPPANTADNPGINSNPNAPGNVNGNFNNRFANTNSLYSITNPPGQLNNQSFGNSFGNPSVGSATMPLQPGINSRLPAGNTLPTANSALPATVAPSPGGNTSPNIVPSAGANSPQAPVAAPSPGVNNNNNNNSIPPNQ